MEIARLTRAKPLEDYVSPWGAPGRLSTTEKILNELGFYSIISIGDKDLEDYKLEIIGEVSMMPQLLRANIIVFTGALYLHHVNRDATDVPDDILINVMERLDVNMKRDNTLDERELNIAVKANILRYFFAIKDYIDNEHEVMDSDEMRRLKDNLDQGEMDEDDDEDMYGDF